jgi:hypothetical protein
MRSSVWATLGMLVTAACNGGDPRVDTAASVRTDSSRQDTVTTVQTDDCVRGEPEPVLAPSAGSPAARFERTGKLTAREDVAIDDSTTLQITHGGCAHYVEGYVFTIRGATRDASETDYWLDRTAALLRSLPVREIRVAQIEELAKTLATEAAKPAPYAYGEPISIPELTTVTLTVARKDGGVVIDLVYDVAL